MTQYSHIITVHRQQLVELLLYVTKEVDNSKNPTPNLEVVARLIRNYDSSTDTYSIDLLDYEYLPFKEFLDEIIDVDVETHLASTSSSIESLNLPPSFFLDPSSFKR